MAKVYSALVHHPVRDKLGEEVATAVTNLDVHDLARSSRTYDVTKYFIVTPVEAQQKLVGGIIGHWIDGPGKKRVPARAEAFSRVSVIDSIATAAEVIEKECGNKARIVVTAARSSNIKTSTFAKLRQELKENDQPTLIVFGTGHGLADSVLEAADMLLEPIQPGGYNHLSVRAAAAITFDRLLGDQWFA